MRITTLLLSLVAALLLVAAASAAPKKTLTVVKVGTGTGTVTSTSPPGGINCGADCTEQYNVNTVVTLSAAPAGGSVFASWAGCNSVNGNVCSVTMSMNKTVTATFNLASVPTVDFTWTPTNPVPNETVNFTCVPNGNVTCQWDKGLDGNPDATGLTWQTSYVSIGTKTPQARGCADANCLNVSTWTQHNVIVVNPQCSDGVDNADPEDTLVDLNDPGCIDANDNDETDPVSGEVRYSKTGEGTANVFGDNSLEQACYPNLPPWTMDGFVVDYCRWYLVTQYNPAVCGPYKDTSDPFAGTNSIRYDVITGPDVTRCEITKKRRSESYTDDWYHSAFKLPTDWAETDQGGGPIHQLGYQNINGSPLYLSADNQSFCCGGAGGTYDAIYILVATGQSTAPGVGGLPYYSGQPIGFGFGPKPQGMPGPLYVCGPNCPNIRNTWHEVLIHVYWTPEANGVIEAWYKVKGDPTWVQKVDVGPVGSGHAQEFNFPTKQLGTQQVAAGCTTVTVANINDDCHWPDDDKMGLYHQNYTAADNVISMHGEFCRASTREAAESCLG